MVTSVSREHHSGPVIQPAPVPARFCVQVKTCGTSWTLLGGFWPARVTCARRVFEHLCSPAESCARSTQMRSAYENYGGAVEVKSPVSCTSDSRIEAGLHLFSSSSCAARSAGVPLQLSGFLCRNWQIGYTQPSHPRSIHSAMPHWVAPEGNVLKPTCSHFLYQPTLFNTAAMTLSWVA